MSRLLRFLMVSSREQKNSIDKFVYALIAASGLAFLKETCLCDYLLWWYRDRENNKVVLLPADVEDLIFDEMNLILDRRAPPPTPWKSLRVGLMDKCTNYAFFAGKSLDFKTIGGPQYLVPAQIGVPMNYFLHAGQTAKEQQKILDRISANCLKGVKVDWSSELGRKLKESLVLSDRAKRFGVERELHRLWYSNWPFFNLVINFVGILGSAEGHLFLTKVMTRKNVPIQLRTIVCGTWLFLFGTLFFGFRALVHVHVYAKGDRGALSFGDEYKEGAVEFYTKELEKNRCIRWLRGYKGTARYTIDGDVVWRFYELHKPRLTACLALAQSYVPEQYYLEKWTKKLFA